MNSGRPQLLLALLLMAAPVLAAPKYRIEEYMDPDGRQASGLQKLTPAELERLNETFSRVIENAINTGIQAGLNQTARPQCPTQPAQAAPPSHRVSRFEDLEGASIVAEDGTFLGKISRNRYDTDSIANNYGAHGGKYSSESIFNNYGQYGSKYSD